MVTLQPSFTLVVGPVTSVEESRALDEAFKSMPSVRGVHFNHTEDDQRAVHTAILKTAGVTDQQFATQLSQELGREIHIESQSGTHLILRLRGAIDIPPVLKPTLDAFPRQNGNLLGLTVKVFFSEDAPDFAIGTILRSDKSGEVIIIDLDDRRPPILGSECYRWEPIW